MNNPIWSHYKALLLCHGQVFHFDKWRYQIQDASLDFIDFVLFFSGGESFARAWQDIITEMIPLKPHPNLWVEIKLTNNWLNKKL